jgi:hypothetical protein
MAMPSRSLGIVLASVLALMACGYDDSPYVPDDAVGPDSGADTTPSPAPGNPGAPEPGNPGAPAPVPCDESTECDDGDACTTDSCEAGFCRNAPVLGCSIPAAF